MLDSRPILTVILPGNRAILQSGYISTTKSLACSAASGGMAHPATYPLHLARTVLQQAVPEGGRQYSG